MGTTHSQIIERFAREAPDGNLLMGQSPSVHVQLGNRTVLQSWDMGGPLCVLMPEPESGLPRGWWLVNGNLGAHEQQRLVRSALQATGLPMLTVPFSALDSAGIIRSSIAVIETDDERWEQIPHTVATREEVPQQFLSALYPDGAEQRHGYLAYVEDGMWHWTEHRHWLGASLFTAEYAVWERNDDGSYPDERTRRMAYFLSAFDNQEPANLYFLAELPQEAHPASIAEALEALKPPEVLRYELEVREALAHLEALEDIDDGERERQRLLIDQPVVRQGDVFAIPTDLTTRQIKSGGTFMVRPGGGTKLGAYVLGVNHTATQVLEVPPVPGDEFRPEVQNITYARGILRHRPRQSWRSPEHIRRRMGDGKTWHRLVKNTVPMIRDESRSWSLGGRVD